MQLKVSFDFDDIHSNIKKIRGKQIFFVCGAIKSGTTWIQLMLDAHPDVSCNGEGHFADRLAPLLTKAVGGYNHAIGAKNRHIFGPLLTYPLVTEDHRLYLLASAITLLLSEQPKSKVAKAIGEKTPDNIRYLGLLSQIFANAKFIHIVRDGRDCAVSCWFHNLRLFNERTRQEFDSIDHFVASFADTWAFDVGSAIGFGEMQPDRYLAVRYEDLIADAGNVAKEMFAFLGVEFDPEIVRNVCAAASFEELSGGRKRGQENRDSFFRKGTSGDWRHLLSDATKQIFLDKAGRWLTRFGYEPV